MVWWVLALAGWLVVAAPVALLVGSAARTAERRERPQRSPAFVPERWAPTPSR
jgi:hypothetical protein